LTGQSRVNAGAAYGFASAASMALVSSGDSGSTVEP
jgi:hypothetical protein